MSADEKGPQSEPTTRPAESNMCHSAMWPVVVEENGRPVPPTMMMTESMTVVMMESMTVVMMESMTVVMDTVMMPVPPVASPAPTPSTPPLHNQL